MNKPFSPSCERNKDPILQILKNWLSTGKYVLEIGSGTGKHAVYFAENLPNLIWQTSDVVENHPGITQWLNEANLDNIKYPITLDVTQNTIEEEKYDTIFTANTFHIMCKSQNLI